MADTISIDQAGRLVLPKKLRDQFNLVGGSKLSVETIGDHLELTPIREEPNLPLAEEKGMLVIPPSGEPFDAAEAVRQEREDRELGQRR